MKTQILTKLSSDKLHLSLINPDESPACYKVTGHTILTAELTAADVMNRFGHDFDSDGHGYLTLVA